MPEMAESLTSVLLGLHAFTGCDSTSAFRGKGEVIPIKILLKSEKFKKAFSLLGSSWKDNDSFLEVMELFVCGQWRMVSCSRYWQTRTCYPKKLLTSWKKQSKKLKMRQT